MEAEANKECRVCFKPKGKATTVAPDSTILSAAIEIGLRLRHNCGGNATCGTCRVQIEEGIENLSPPNEREHDLLGEDRLATGHRLACQSKVMGPVTAIIPSWILIPEKTDEPTQR